MLEKIYYWFYVTLRAFGNEHEIAVFTCKLFMIAFFMMPIGIIVIDVFSENAWIIQYFELSQLQKRIVVLLLFIPLHPILTIILNKRKWSEIALDKYNSEYQDKVLTWQSKALLILRAQLLVFWSLILAISLHFVSELI